MNSKKGNIEIIFLIFTVTIFIIFSFLIYILYIQITTYIIPIKQDLFYIVQNSYFALNQNSLEYEDYIINNRMLKNKVGKILKNNYPNVSINYIYYDKNQNRVNIQVIVTIKPIVLGDYIGNIKIRIKDIIKLKMMEVE